MYLEPFEILVDAQNDVRGKAREHVLNEKVVSIQLAPSTDLVALFERFGFSRRGSKAWSHGTADNNDNRQIRQFFKRYIETFLPGTLQAKAGGFTALTRLHPVLTTPTNLGNTAVRYGLGHPLFGMRYYAYAEADLANPGWAQYRPTITATSAQRVLEFVDTIRPGNVNSRRVNERYNYPAVLSFEIVNGTMWARAEVIDDEDTIWDDVQVFPRNQDSIRHYTPDTVGNVIHEIEVGHFSRLLDMDDYTKDLIDYADTQVTVRNTPGKPAEAIVQAGCKADTLRIGRGVPTVVAGETVTMPLDRVLKYKGERVLHIAESVIDVANMANAKPFTEYGEGVLEPYQEEAVGLHLATTLGYVNACEPGMGKTVMQLSAMRETAKKTPAYRGLIVCESTLREQWSEELAKWFPEAKIVTVFDDKKETRKALMNALVDVEPVVVILAYSTTLKVTKVAQERQEVIDSMRGLTGAQMAEVMNNMTAPVTNIGSLLLDTRFHDIAADEATVIRNGGSQQSDAMWILRSIAQKGVALIGTPINKEAQDLLRLVAWVRGDRRLFSGFNVKDNYDLETADGAKEFFESFGPLVFRRDKSLIRHKLPKVATLGGSTLLLQPSNAEKALADAAEHELRRCYFELLAALEEVDEGAVDSAALAEAKANLKDARGAWLGGTQLARMATSDPASLLSSTSNGAALLKGQGLVDAALSDVPAKRKKLLEIALERVEKGERLIVFTDFATVADVLVDFLRANGFRSEAFKGGTRNRDQFRIAFQEGEIDVLVATRAGERGLNLQRANAVIHYDMPWKLERVIQRSGRAMRLGSTNKEVDIIYLILEDTIDKRIAEGVVSIASLSTLILDNSRGVDVSNTDTGSTVGGLTKTIAGSSSTKGILALGELLGGETKAA